MIIPDPLKLEHAAILGDLPGPAASAFPGRASRHRRGCGSADADLPAAPAPIAEARQVKVRAVPEWPTRWVRWVPERR
ncbi:hypothetical protein Q0Z83_051990 [Actinoplanes sichuanensis]|nr:hypothetical protein Q0Z83_051990 [Actinoplanes sichuanensis]